MAIEHPIPVDVLRQLLRLDPATGRLNWLPRGVEWFRDGGHTAAQECARWNTRYAGKGALATPHGDGYLHGRILYRLYLAHIVAFALHHGRWAEGDVDHRDGNRSDNRPGNLREATKSQNRHNTGSLGGVSRFKGVHWHKRDRKWYAACMTPSGKIKHIGTFADEFAAARAYDDATRVHHGEFAKPNFSPSAE